MIVQLACPPCVFAILQMIINNMLLGLGSEYLFPFRWWSLPSADELDVPSLRDQIHKIDFDVQHLRGNPEGCIIFVVRCCPISDTYLSIMDCWSRYSVLYVWFQPPFEGVGQRILILSIRFVSLHSHKIPATRQQEVISSDRGTNQQKWHKSYTLLDHPCNTHTFEWISLQSSEMIDSVRRGRRFGVGNS